MIKVNYPCPTSKEIYLRGTYYICCYTNFIQRYSFQRFSLLNSNKNLTYSLWTDRSLRLPSLCLVSSFSVRWAAGSAWMREFKMWPRYVTDKYQRCHPSSLASPSPWATTQMTHLPLIGQAFHWPQVRPKVSVYWEEMYFSLTFLLRRFKVQCYLLISTAAMDWSSLVRFKSLRLTQLF